VKDAGIDLPPGARLESVGARQKQDSIVALVPVLEAAPDVGLRGARLEAHERVGEGVLDLIVLRGKVIRLGLAFLPDLTRERVVLVQVVRNRAHVVEELTEQIPSALTVHR
jgi:hypothetical protein